jgi:MoxR-like ATPase
MTAPITSLDQVRALAQLLRERVRADVIGRDDIIELVLVALFSDGHVLLEDYPGSGKTTLAKALGASIGDDLPNDGIADFRRIQFTPDLLPSDITGVTVFDTVTNGFSFRPGPVFAYVVLVDEINRTSPKVQSAMLEAMAEKQVTVDNVSHKLDELFFVLATQNPLDSVGTYPLPLAQLDRFLFKLKMKHVDRASELEVLRTWGQPHVFKEFPKVARGQVVQAIPALQTLAMLRGRDFVSSDDIEYLVTPLFAHRLEVTPGSNPDALIREAIEKPLDTLSLATLEGR